MSYSEQQHLIIKHIKELASELNRPPTKSEVKMRFPNLNMSLIFGSFPNALIAAGLSEKEIPLFEKREPKILIVDLELKPNKVWAWGLWDQNISLDMIIEEWSILSFAAKFLGKSEVIYHDLSQNTDYNDDRLLVIALWHLIDECDILITQNGKRFDEKKMNAKFEEYGLGPPRPFQHIDTLQIKKKKFGLLSNKLEYSTNKFNVEYKKLKHKNFPGMSLWIECLKGNQDAWAEMKEYNIHDVLSTEELWVGTLRKWDTSINFGVFNGNPNCCPNCGGTELVEREYSFTRTGMYQNFQCVSCKSFSRSKENLLTKAQRKGLLK